MTNFRGTAPSQRLVIAYPMIISVTNDTAGISYVHGINVKCFMISGAVDKEGIGNWM